MHNSCPAFRLEGEAAGASTFGDHGFCGIMVSMDNTSALPRRSCILVVDDQRSMRATTTLLLLSEGHHVIEASSGEEALAMLAMSNVDLMLTNLKMEAMDGLTLLRRALEQVPHLRVIILTAFGSKQSAEESMRLGAYDYLQKP
jgi:two-component system response regulator HydG